MSLEEYVYVTHEGAQINYEKKHSKIVQKNSVSVFFTLYYKTRKQLHRFETIFPLDSSRTSEGGGHNLMMIPSTTSGMDAWEIFISHHKLAGWPG